MSKIIFLTFLFLLMAILPINSSEYHEVGEVRYLTEKSYRKPVKHPTFHKLVFYSDGHIFG